jgi:hypothetical protein
MRMLNTRFKKTIKCRVIANNGEVKIRFPKQNIGWIALEFNNGEKKVILRQWDIVLKGDSLETNRIK